jgi:hypothetical protein
MGILRCACAICGNMCVYSEVTVATVLSDGSNRVRTCNPVNHRLRRMPSSGMLRLVTLVRTDDSRNVGSYKGRTA